MSKPRVPKLGKARRRARFVGRVVLSGEHLYTKAEWGPGDQPSPDCLEEYLALLGAWKARGCAPRTKALSAAVPRTMGELVASWGSWLESSGRYRKDGQPTTTWQFLRPTMASWVSSFGTVPVRQLTRQVLMSYRDDQEHLVGLGKLLPATVNRRLARLREFLVWAIQRECLSEGLGWIADHLPRVKNVHHADVVRARTKPKRAVSWADVNAMTVHLSVPYWTMAQVQRLVGCRPGEVCSMHALDIDTSVQPWKWRPSTHKTQHHGHELVYRLPVAAQLLVGPLLRGGWVFRRGLVPNGRSPHGGLPVTTQSYLEAIERACKAAGVPRFTPHELRHAVATERANDPSLSLAAAGRSLGHRRISSLQPYVHDNEREIQRASEVS